MLTGVESVNILLFPSECPHNPLNELNGLLAFNEIVTILKFMSLDTIGKVIV
jgi:hypothetical protein